MSAKLPQAPEYASGNPARTFFRSGFAGFRAQFSESILGVNIQRGTRPLRKNYQKAHAAFLDGHPERAKDMREEINSVDSTGRPAE